MTYITKTVADAAIGVAVADDPAALSALHTPGCAAAILRRAIAPPVRTWLDALDPDQLPVGRMVVQTTHIGQAVRQMADLAKTPTGNALDWLQHDIADLAATFAHVMSTRVLRLRLDAVSTNACSRFHVDALTARLVCTYRGQGTQYGISTDGRAPARVFQVATGSPILLRGTLWPEDPPCGLLHRSPPIAGTGETRLVLVLDPIFDADDAP